MIIFIEGLDKVGKDTLINKLIVELNAFIINNEPPKDASETEEMFHLDRYRILYKQAIMNNDKNIIFNRCSISQRVYSGVKRKRDSMNNSLIDNIEGMMHGIKHILIYLYNSNEEEMKERMIREKEEYIKFEERKILHERYLTAINISPLNSIIIDVTNKSKDEVFDEVIRIVKDKGKKRP